MQFKAKIYEFIRPDTCSIEAETVRSKREKTCKLYEQSHEKIYKAIQFNILG